MQVRITLRNYEKGKVILVDCEIFENHCDVECQQFLKYCWDYLEKNLLAKFEVEGFNCF